MPEDLFAAAGGLSEIYAGVDWEATALGPVAGWSPTLRRAVRLMLDTGFPASLFWGPEFVLVYNEAFRPLIGDKHPGALGSAAAEVFEEAWPTIGPLMRSVTAGQGAVWLEDAPVPLTRGESLQEAFFTFSYSPVRNDDGEIEGMMDISAETTRQVVDRRRLVLLSRLRELLAQTDETDGFAERVAAILGEDLEDLPRIGFRGLSGVADLDGVPGPTEVLELPLDVIMPGGAPAALVVAPNPQLVEDPLYVPFLRLVASTVGQALARSASRARERRSAQDERLRSETLQRALLTEPPRRDDELHVAVRYLPAAIDAEVGGDWYDAFTTPARGLALVIGDVTGHDRDAAAAMGQVRNVLRGIAHTLPEPPDRLLSELDGAMTNLGVDVLATAILAQLGPESPDGSRELVWSNAGHPPPVHIARSGRASLIEADPDALLGLGQPARRRNHTLTLEPGSAVVFYTDGLVERRGSHLDAGFRWLCGVLDSQGTRPPEEIADHVLAQLGGPPEDDVALLVLAL